MQIIMLPLMLFGLSRATLIFTGGQPRRAALAMQVAAPLTQLAMIDVGDFSSYLNYESYAVALVLLLGGLPLLHAMATNADSNADGAATLAMAYAILLTGAKIPVGAVWTAATLVVLLRARRLSPRGWGIVILLLLIHAFVALRYILPDDNVATSGFGPMHFVLTFPVVAAINLLIIGAAAFFHLRDWRAGRDRLWQETVLAIFVASVVPALLVRLEGGAVYYFLNIATWVAIASLSARFITATANRGRIAPLAACASIFVLCVVVTPQKLRAYPSLRGQRQALLDSLDPAAAARFAHTGILNPLALKAVRSASAHAVGGEIGTLLQKAGAVPGADMAVFVAPDFRAYWRLPAHCNMAPFLIPGLYGLPMLEGIPPDSEHCDLDVYYGYRFFGPDSHARATSDAMLCIRARRKGYSRVAVLEGPAVAHRLDCAPVARQAKP
jgi:hypothetical protein